ncbi:MAG: hypothetical protein AAGM67_19550, partial [Bacteroidota bacterium]
MKKILLSVLIALLCCATTGMMSLPDSVYTHQLVQLLRQKIEHYQFRYDSEKIYCHTDRSLYCPGESIWASVYLQNTNGNPNTPLSQKAYLELIDPKGQVIQRKAVALHAGRG